MHSQSHQEKTKLNWTEIYNVHRLEIPTLILELCWDSERNGYRATIQTCKGTVASKLCPNSLDEAKALAVRLAFKYTRKALAILEDNFPNQ